MINSRDNISSDDVCPNIVRDLNADILSDSHKDLIKRMIEADQHHLFKGWDAPGTETDRKMRFLDDLVRADSSYPGGISAYVSNARLLLAEAKLGSNPFEGYQPQQPDTIDLTDIDDSYIEYERLGAANLDKLAIILVAGGLGERLGYPGIKINIPLEVTTDTTYLEHYTSVIKAMEARMATRQPVPFIIMTSRDTHESTLDALEANSYYGLDKTQVIILRQELVPAISDNDGHIALNSPYSVAMKPHGHGDIHMLMHMSGTAARLASQGIEQILFIQDTNGQVFNAALAAIGASIKNELDFNSVAVNRIPGEAVGALAKLSRADDTITINVEYNQLDPLLRSTISPDGDIPNDKGFSIFPGNINVLIANLQTYCKVLEESRGIIAEFVNPKYNDDTRTTFKKPTRLETMMQDLPKLFKHNEKVGVTIFDRKWCFSPNKNNVADAQKKHQQGGPPESGATAESDFYLAGRMKLNLANSRVTESDEELIMGIPFTRGPKVILTPRFALTIDELRSKLRNIEISGEATLVLDGRDINIDGLKMSGSSALVIQAEDDAKVTLTDKEIDNEGYELVLVDPQACDDSIPPYLKIRGYKFNNIGAEVHSFSEAGTYEI